MVKEKRILLLILRNPCIIYICNWYCSKYLKSTNFTENNFRYEDIIFVDVNTPGPGRLCQFLEVKVWNNKNSGLSIGLARPGRGLGRLLVNVKEDFRVSQRPGAARGSKAPSML